MVDLVSIGVEEHRMLVASAYELGKLQSAADFLRERNIIATGRYHVNPLDLLIQVAIEAGWREGGA